MYKYVLILAALLILPGAAYADADLTNWLYNVATQVPSLIRLIVAIAYVSGFAFLVSAISRFKRCAQSITMMSSQESVGGPVILLMVGVALLYFAGFVQVGSQTLFGSASILAYQDSNLGTQGDTFSSMIGPILLILRLVGYIAFLKGLYLLGRLSGHNAQPGTLGKGLVHILGGILAINIEVTYVVLLNTLQGPSI